MRSKKKSTNLPIAATTSNRPSQATRRTPPANAFSEAFLLQAAKLEDPSFGNLQCLSGGACWAGPWEVEPFEVEHGTLWAVVRAGDPLAEGGRAVAVFRSRATALLTAAVLPTLAVPDRIHLGETTRRLGVPIHDGDVCLGHLSRPEPSVVTALHVARTLALHPHSLAFLVEALGPEDLPILGRALMRRIEER